VSWADATAYVQWLSKKTGKTYRPLSEAEREYVTRGGVYDPYWWGTRISADDANYDGTRAPGAGKPAIARQKTVPVKTFEENPLGLYQVHGNVWEWTADCWNANHDGNPGDGTASATGDCARRVLKGGAWNSDPASLRSASRLDAPVYARSNAYGLRVARELER
jgi:formylglycine-generating enzyme required for sulfatase activity